VSKPRLWPRHMPTSTRSGRRICTQCPGSSGTRRCALGRPSPHIQLAKKLGAKRVLVVTFKPAVEDAWQSDLESHLDFDGWQYLSRHAAVDPRAIDRSRPFVYFGSFQDLLGRDDAGNIKPKNEWLHEINWDLVVFDEYPLRRLA